ncbi:Monocarboxylate transporter 2 [Dissostichus eleginoides]|uniref:Monocarboxylate transporter 2 n=1 Tax=Dissostichus eleginoides TaxID=100907 RepID=A0AAD9CIR6_DISEL|nr:Monocarboxylate transporter 2 [Dissostichus eleginoides]
MSPAPADELGRKPLDGGWGWMVVVGAHISIGFAYSTPKVLSIFYKEIQENLGASSSEIAWISSIMLAAMYAGGPVSSMLVTRFGSRPIVMAGGLMCGVSMVTASFGNSMVYLYLCIGIIGGCGLSLNLNASLTIISKYFLVKRPLANGLAMAGSPVFLCLLAPLNQYLLYTYGWRGSFLILGGLMLNCCVAGALMRPVIASSYAIDQGVEEFSAAYLLTIMGFVDMFVRPATGLIASSKRVRPRIQYFFSFALVFTGTVHLLCPTITVFKSYSYSFLATYAVFFGIGFGMVFAYIRMPDGPDGK